ncbi:P-loop NTPase [Candidatus Gracilibacteria bacterium]|nr:P-loop NTPase [Candidatus Gracilibacteria bacterium]
MGTVKLQPQSLEGIKKIIGIVSGKGGVGKTFLATNLALIFAKNNFTVGLMDADIAFPDVFQFLGITSKINPTMDNKMQPVEKYGIRSVSMAGLSEQPDEPLMWRGPINVKIMQQFLKETTWGPLDILFIDFPSNISDHALTLLQHYAIDGLIAVTTPQKAALQDTRRLLKSAEIFSVPILGIVENMRGEIFGEAGSNRLAEEFHTSMIGSIPLRRNIAVSCDEGKPALFSSEELQFVFTKMARFIADKLGV